jgi:S-adenosylmethionine:tRNA ribosyltransferase-isomerase
VTGKFFYTRNVVSELNQYDYDLPDDLIAQQPVSQRSDARLMVVRREEALIEHYHVRDLPELLEAGDCLVLNDTRVIPARLAGIRTGTGGRWEGLFLDCEGNSLWKILAKTRGKLSVGEQVTLLDREGRAAAQLELVERLDSGAWLVSTETNEKVLDLLERIGRVPLPHYIRRGEMLPEDLHRYQTVYAKHAGSIAAPTAGLHFTDPLLQRLERRHLFRTTVTLHVGWDTFRPISTERVADHQMHSEWCRLDEEAAERIRTQRARGGRIIAVGSTSMRVLETAAASGHLQPWAGRTDLFIRPPYEFRAVDALMTNFHLPRTTLLVLVRCFGGDALIRRAYAEAIEQKYRFYSYGDAMLIL